MGRQYQRWTGMDFASSTRAAENKMEKDCCEFICGAPTTFKGYGIDEIMLEFG